MQKEIINDNRDITSNSQQIKLLKENFPQCFDKDGNFITHKMEEVVGESGIELSKESYSLNWLGKGYARLLANETPRTLLKEDREHNSKEQNRESQNLLIKGDNLEVLKHLSNAYKEAIKMIYIDPPYNTGSDGFVYNDNRKFLPEELSRLAGIELERAFRILDFTKNRENSHSAWLTFMYPRLYIARHLLREDGVIFISIDDNEQAQLKLLCDEVFGEENFVEQIIWKKRATPPNDRNIGRLHEYILCYAKQETKIELGLLPRDEKSIARYKNPDNNPRGAWVMSDLSANGKGGRISQTTIYPIMNPKTKIEHMPSEGRCWLFNKEKMNLYIKEGRIGFREKTGTPYLKRYLSEVRQGLTLPTILTDFGFSSTSASELDKLFIKKGLFEYAKPTTLLKVLLNIGIINKEDFILDFFAGSGTTAHAVMQLNAEDNGDRKFITVQIPEEIDKKSEAYKAGYKTIFDITKARIEKATVKISKEYPEYKGDLGFKIYETMPMWEGYLDDIETLTDESVLFDGFRLNDEELHTLLTTWKVYDGIKLSDELDEIVLSGYMGYMGGETLYFVHTEFTTEALIKLIEKLDSDKTFEPSRIVLFGYNFNSKYQRELQEALNSYSNKKSIELDLVVRY